MISKCLDSKIWDDSIFIALNRTFFKEIIKQTPLMGSINLKQQWEIERIAPFNYTIYNNYGDFVMWFEEGKEPYIISAKNKKFLRFKKPQSGPKKNHPKLPNNIAFEKDGYIFTKKVLHPGFEAQQFLKRILEDKTLYDKFETELMKEVEKRI